MYEVGEQACLVCPRSDGKDHLGSLLPQCLCTIQVSCMSLSVMPAQLTTSTMLNRRIQNSHKVCKYGIDMVQASQHRDDIRTWIRVFLGQDRRQEGPQCLSVDVSVPPLLLNQALAGSPHLEHVDRRHRPRCPSRPRLLLRRAPLSVVGDAAGRPVQDRRGSSVVSPGPA